MKRDPSLPQSTAFEPMRANRNSRPSGLLVAVVVIAALYLAKVVFIPLALASLLSLLLSPVVLFFEKIKVPRIIAIFLVVLTLLGLMGLIGWKTSQEFVDVTQELPKYKTTLEDKIHSVRGSRSQSLSNATDTVHDLEKDVAAATPGSPSSNDAKKLSSSLGSSPSKPMAVEVIPPANPLESVENLLGPLGTLLIIVVFTFFILMGREDLRNRFIRLAAGRRLNAMTQALDDATRRINRYLLLQLSVNVAYGFFIGTALSLTRPAVARVFSSAFPWRRAHFFVGARIASVSGVSVHLRSP